MTTGNINGHIRAEDVKAAALGREDDICIHFGFTPESMNGQAGPCLQCGGHDRARKIAPGAYRCNQCHPDKCGDLLASIGWLNKWDFPETVRNVADYLGLKPSTSPSKSADPFRHKLSVHGASGSEASRQRIRNSIAQWCKIKSPIEVDSVLAFGGEVVTFPAHSDGVLCIAWKAFNNPTEEATGYILRRCDGELFEAFGNIAASKTRMLKDSKDGWVIGGGVERIAKADIVWKCEGLPDAMALFSVVPENHAVITNICGAKSVPSYLGHFANKPVFIISQCDKPGMEGAEKYASKILSVASYVKVIHLPWYDVTEKNGKDVRDAFRDGHTFQELVDLSSNAPVFTKRTRQKPDKSTTSLNLQQYAPNPTAKQAEQIDEWRDIASDKGRSDIANSRRFLEQHSDKLLHCHPWGKWLVWSGTHWKVDDSGAVMRLAKATADSIWSEIPRAATSDEALATAIAFARGTSGMSRIRAFVDLSASELPVQIDELDQNRWLLNCPNGTVDLRTGELKPHQRSDCVTKLCPTNFTPDAPSYHFDKFLDGIFGDQRLIDFVQRLFGYCLSGSTVEQILPVFWGQGSNGKSTLLGALSETLGNDYSGTAPSSLLMEKKTESHPTDLASLFGKRFVIASESSQGARLAEAQVKQLTGSDAIVARRMREDFWSFIPTHKLLLMTNHKPAIRGTDHGIWRRLILVPFTVQFWNPAKGESGPPELMRDNSLADKLKAESEGILAWMVRGCLEWQRLGLQVPDIVRAATTEYRSESDTVGRFISDKCLIGDGAYFKVRFSQLYDALEEWCKDAGDNLPSKKFVGQYLGEQGFKDKQSGVKWYLGLTMKATETTV